MKNEETKMYKISKSVLVLILQFLNICYDGPVAEVSALDAEAQGSNLG